MRTIEESILIAALDGDDVEAQRLIDQMLPNEKSTLRSAAMRIERLAAGAPDLMQALTR